MNSEPQSSEIVTFYSYKGGTGRTLALANAACLLARRHPDEKVLMIDWDLEAPGLHRYFRNQLRGDGGRDAHEGLIDFFTELDRRSAIMPLGNGDAAAEAVERIYKDIGLDRYIAGTNVCQLHLMKAGRFDDQYTNRVNSFDWSALFKRSEWLIRLLVDRLKEKYRYILIDSRTGITDTSGICTTLLPDKLVLVFTPNRQSLTGIKDLVQSATTYRRKSGDIRPLMVFPLPSRVEASRQSLREKWRFAKDEADMIGYQPLFEELFQSVYKLPECDLQNYFDEVQIQHEADYAYGEEIAVLVEDELSQDRFSLVRSFETLTSRLETQPAPWAEIDAGAKGAPAVKRLALLKICRRCYSSYETFLRRHVLLTTAAFAACLALLVVTALKWNEQRRRWTAMQLAYTATTASEERARTNFEELKKNLDSSDELARLNADRLAQFQNLATDLQRQVGERDKRIVVLIEHGRAATNEMERGKAILAERFALLGAAEKREEAATNELAAFKAVLVDALEVAEERLTSLAEAQKEIKTLRSQLSSDSTAQVRAVRGTAEYSTDRGSTWKNLKVGMKLGRDAVVRTPKGSTVDLYLAGAGSVIRVTEDTLLAIDNLSSEIVDGTTVSQTQLDLRSGRIVGNVRKLEDAWKAVLTKSEVEDPTKTSKNSFLPIGVEAQLWPLRFDIRNDTVAFVVKSPVSSRKQDVTYLDVVLGNGKSASFKVGEVEYRITFHGLLVGPISRAVFSVDVRKRSVYEIKTPQGVAGIRG